MKEKGRFKQFAAAGFCMFVCILLLRTPVSAKTANIKCGEHATAVLDDLGTLTIDGSGDMYDQVRMAEPNGSDHIFQDIYTDVYRIVIGDKITHNNLYAGGNVNSGKHGIFKIHKRPFTNCRYPFPDGYALHIRETRKAFIPDQDTVHIF